MKRTVYLAGPVRGLGYEDTVSWRQDAVKFLAPEITCISPMRGKDSLKGKTINEDTWEKDNPIFTHKGIVRRDFFDVSRCDLVLVNFLDAQEHSTGTLVEIGYATALDKPIIIAMEADNRHVHPFVTENAMYVVDTLEKALILTKLTLTG